MLSHSPATGLPVFACIALLLTSNPESNAGQPYAGSVVAFDQGVGGNPDYDDPAVTLGPPERASGEGVFPRVVTPFFPPFGPDEIVSLAPGGFLELAFDQPIVDDPDNPYGIDLIVFGNAGLIDALQCPTADCADAVVGGIFGADGGQIDVSVDGINWVQLAAEVDGFAPTLGYTDVPAFGLEPGRQESNFLRPLNPCITLSMVDGLHAEALGGFYLESGGGTGIDLSGSGLSEVNFVRISHPADATGDIEIDAVADVASVTPGDVDGNGQVDVNDLVSVVLGWGPLTPHVRGDLNGDCQIDVQDLTSVILNWGVGGS